jgi:molybdate transport system permease protein
MRLAVISIVISMAALMLSEFLAAAAARRTVAA